MKKAEKRENVQNIELARGRHVLQTNNRQLNSHDFFLLCSICFTLGWPIRLNHDKNVSENQITISQEYLLFRFDDGCSRSFKLERGI